MNSTTITPEVQDFLTAVRAQLADLDPDEQRDITEGLEADLTDLVAERGGEALGDPVAYARELRAAAGLEPEMQRTRERLDLSTRVHTLFDAIRGRWDRSMASLPGDAPSFLAALRPAWWVLRGWIAVQVAAMWLGDWALTIVPGGDPAGAGAVLLGILVSIQLGRGRLWPADGWRRVALLRILLVGLNCLAVAMIPVVLNGLEHGRTDRYSRGFELGYQQGARDIRDAGVDTDKAGMYVDGKWVSNIYPYDAQGRPLVGVQLYNQVGDPINVVTQPEYVDDINNSDEGRPRIYYPWTNGAAQLFNVFPIPSRVQDSEDPSPTAFSEKVRPAITPYPFALVPKVSLPGISTGRQPVPVAPAEPGS